MPKKRTDGFEKLPVPRQQDEIDRYEDLKIPYGKMTGRESAKQFKLRDHQPRLM